MALAEEDTRERWRYYEQLAGVARVAPHLPCPSLRPGRRRGHPVTVDLRTRYLGLELRRPLVASPSPLTGELEGLVRLEGQGSGRWCCRRCSRSSSPTTSWSWTGCWRRPPTTPARKSLLYFPDLADYNTGPWSYLDHITQAGGPCRCR